MAALLARICWAAAAAVAALLLVEASWRNFGLR